MSTHNNTRVSFNIFEKQMSKIRNNNNKQMKKKKKNQPNVYI